MKIRILCVGHLKEKYWKAAEDEYVKRLGAYCKVEIEELDDLATPEKASEAIELSIKEKEGGKILSKTKPSDFICTLDLNKDEPDSITLSKKMMKMIERSGSNLTFVIGGSLGLSEQVRKRANESLSLSKLTFTHQMTRIILLEQIYRSFKIAHNEPYHK